MIKHTLIFSFCLFAFTVFAQSPPSGLSCEQVRSWIKVNHYDGQHTELGYNEARRRMYGAIDNEPTRNTVVCVYSGYEDPLPYNVNNSTTYPNPINCEHTVPQSFYGSAEPMRSDIHHLFPTYQNWNSLRSNFPFSDIDDATTTAWLIEDIAINTIPTNRIDEHSEYFGSTFEPREDHKGDLARAVMYFYTMYPSVGNINDCGDIYTLMAWHYQDPPSAKEIERNNRIETYQGNRNPYVDDVNLVDLAWGCLVDANNQPQLIDNIALRPNPVQDMLYVETTINEATTLTYTIVSATGQIINRKRYNKDAGSYSFSFSTRNLAAGTYMLTVSDGTGQSSHTFVKQ